MGNSDDVENAIRKHPEVATVFSKIGTGDMANDPMPMNAGDTYMPAVEIDEVMRALVIGTVVESRHDRFSVGDQVSGMFGSACSQLAWL